MKARIVQRVTLLLTLVMLFACGASQREKTIRATLITVNASSAGFVKLDAAVQARIIEQAVSEDAGKAELLLHRAAREDVLKAFIAAYHAIAAAVLLNDDPKSLSNVLEAAKLLKDALEQFTHPNK